MSIKNRGQTKLKPNKLYKISNRLLRTHSSLQLLVSENFNDFCLSVFPPTNMNRKCASLIVFVLTLPFDVDKHWAAPDTMWTGRSPSWQICLYFQGYLKDSLKFREHKISLPLSEKWSIIYNLISANKLLVLLHSFYNSFLFIRMLT
jgi:hypothetical protein